VNELEGWPNNWGLVKSLDVLQEPKAKPLAPATGIIVGIGLSIMLWSFIILMSFIIVIVFWI